jgi:hypothetical protein
MKVLSHNLSAGVEEIHKRPHSLYSTKNRKGEEK